MKRRPPDFQGHGRLIAERRFAGQNNLVCKMKGITVNWRAMDSFPISAELLKLRGEAQAIFHARAASAGAPHCGRRVFIRGVVERLTVCRELSTYWGMR